MNVIIIGLPGSGKSTLMKQYASTHILYDDFLNTIYDYRMINALKNGKLVCISDPRLCNPKIFNMYIDKYFNPNNTILIIFENNPIKCFHNLKSRERFEYKDKIYKRWKNTLIKFVEIYNIETYKKWHYIIQPVKINK